MWETWEDSDRFQCVVLKFPFVLFFNSKNIFFTSEIISPSFYTDCETRSTTKNNLLFQLVLDFGQQPRQIHDMLVLFRARRNTLVIHSSNSYFSDLSYFIWINSITVMKHSMQIGNINSTPPNQADILNLGLLYFRLLFPFFFFLNIYIQNFD